jgi:hypothetical protein
MTISTRRLVGVCAAVAALVAAAPQPAAAASSYCSPTGDYCYAASKRPPVRLTIALAARYFRSYRLCVTGPDGERDCKRFRVRRVENGIWQGKVRWARHFPNRGRGVYRVRWFALGNALGPGATFTR